MTRICRPGSGSRNLAIIKPHINCPPLEAMSYSCIFVFGEPISGKIIEVKVCFTWILRCQHHTTSGVLQQSQLLQEIRLCRPPAGVACAVLALLATLLSRREGWGEETQGWNGCAVTEIGDTCWYMLIPTVGPVMPGESPHFFASWKSVASWRVSWGQRSCRREHPRRTAWPERRGQNVEKRLILASIFATQQPVLLTAGSFLIVTFELGVPWFFHPKLVIGARCKSL